MFVSIKHKEYLGYNSKINLYECKFELTDSEFRTVVVLGSVRGDAGWRGLLLADVGIIISEYSKRNLNVAANLIKLIISYKEKYNWSINAQLNCYREYQPLFTKEIEEELQKYLTLI